MKNWSFVIVAIVSLALLGANCQKEKNQPNEADQFSEFIFGSAHGFCVGNCVHLFKIAEEKIYPDLMDRGNPAEATFSNAPLDNAKYLLALPIIEAFPEELFNEKEIIGCPNCYDQGEYFIQIKKEGKVYQWRIDTKVSDLPAYLQSYATTLGEVILSLKEE